MLIRVFLCAFLTVCAAVAVRAEEGPGGITAEQETFFETSIRPVLAAACYECHSAKKQQYGLRVDSREFLLKGGEEGSVLTPGNLEKSRLWKVLQHDPLDTQMPPKGKLPAEKLAAIGRWIEMGAPWPKGAPAATAEKPAVDWREHWAFQPIARPELPAVKREGWSLTGVDRFVLAKLEAAGVEPSEAVERAVYLRRLKYDLLGLPATYEEIVEFAGSSSPNAYAELVDRYLASPHFGERWARHWMDVSRYADTKGYVFTADRNYADAWRYREWVIGAFNRDLPYDRFLQLQLAADQLAEDDSDLHAMGYLTLGRRFLNNRNDIIDDWIDVTTRGMMGLTVTCARCHDHKFDPIPTADYYSLYGVFDSSQEVNDGPSSLMLKDKDRPSEPRIFVRGQPGNRGERVPRQFLEVIARDDRKPFEQGSGRAEMARAIASAENPLTARVWVNRVWGHLTGKELVRTPSDFGLRSDRPTHPDLLDYLAARLIDNGWSTKQLIREIVLSQTYRQQSVVSAALAERDPENTLLSHMNRRRVDFEGLRDAMLSAAGTLDPAIGGTSVDITKEPFPTRRTVYAFIDRQNLPGLFRAFDFAGPDTHAPKRHETNVPQQALFLMNSPFVLQQSTRLVSRLEGSDPASRLRQLYRMTLGREPTEAEVAKVTAFVESSTVKREVVASVWSYGYGDLDAEAGRLKSFTALAHFTGTAWQGGGELPDAKLGWVTLNADGGHVGNDLAHAAVRRWTAPADGTLSIRGLLKHKEEQGDGVRSRVLVDGAQWKDAWEAHFGFKLTNEQDIAVQAGQTVDFVTDCKGNVSFDSFEWKVKLTLEPAAGGAKLEFDSAAEFNGPAAGPLDPWVQVGQVLLLSNEFQFVD